MGQRIQLEQHRTPQDTIKKMSLHGDSWSTRRILLSMMSSGRYARQLMPYAPAVPRSQNKLTGVLLGTFAHKL